MLINGSRLSLNRRTNETCASCIIILANLPKCLSPCDIRRIHRPLVGELAKLAILMQISEELGLCLAYVACHERTSTKAAEGITLAVMKILG